MCLQHQVPDPEKIDEFGEWMVDTLNRGSLALMVSIGHRTGLFDAMDGLGASTSSEIAEAADLNERYVREWLGAMVTGGIVDYEADGKTYSLPPEKAACLTRNAAPDNLAAFAMWVPLLGGVEDGIVDCFHSGGGLSYDDYPRFQEVMAQDSGQTVVPAILDTILPLVPGLTDRLDEGIDVLDVGCGAGRALTVMAEAFPGSRFTGLDISTDGIEEAKKRVRRKELSNVEFVRIDAADFDEPDSYDLITAFDAIHDQARPRRVLARIERALRDGGTFLMQDIGASSHVGDNLDHPIGPFLYTVSCMHCMSVSLGAGGPGLGAMWGEEKARQMLSEAGFQSIDVHDLEHDIQNYYYVCESG